MDEIGKEMIRYRSYGINDKVLGEESEKIFQDDHDLVYDLYLKRSAWTLT